MIPRRKIESEKLRKIRECPKCHGISCGYCLSYCSFIDKMAEAEIPTDYWYREMRAFYGERNFKEATDKYIENIDMEYEKGLVMYFVGDRGRGKTMAACCILKRALLKDYTAFYITLSDLVAQVTGLNPELKILIKQYDFVVIDEVDQRFFPTVSSMELYGGQLENVLRGRSHNRLPTILCSNSADIGQIFGGEFRNSFESLKSQFIKVIPAIGQDARKEKEKL